MIRRPTLLATGIVAVVLSCVIASTAAQAVTVTRTIDLTYGPTAIAVSPDGSKAYIANDGAQIHLFDTSTDTFSPASIYVGTVTYPDVTAMAFSSDMTKLYVVIQNEDAVWIIDTVTNTVLPTVIPVGDGAIDIAVFGTTAYVSNSYVGTVSVIDTNTDTVSPTTIPAGTTPMGITITPNGLWAIVANNGSNELTVIDTTTNTATGSLTSAATSPPAVGFSPDGSKTYVVSSIDNSVSIIEVDYSTVVGAVAAVITGRVPVGDLPMDLSVAPDGRIYVSNRLGATVSVIDPDDNSVERVAVGLTPGAIAIMPGGVKAYVISHIGRFIAVLDPAALAEPVDPGTSGNSEPELAVSGLDAVVSLMVGTLATAVGTVLVAVGIRRGRSSKASTGSEIF